MVAIMTRYKNHSARVAPASLPLPTDIQEAIDAVMRGNDPAIAFYRSLGAERLDEWPLWKLEIT